MLRQFLKMDVVCCYRTDSLSHACHLMRDREVGSVLVVDKLCRLEGIVTDRDIALRICEDTDRKGLTVDDVMTEDLHTVSCSDGIADVIEVMYASSVRRVPVVDECGHPLGVLTSGDILFLLAYELNRLTGASGRRHEKFSMRAGE